MKRQSWTEFRKNIEKVIKEFGLSDKLKNVNITQIEKIINVNIVILLLILKKLFQLVVEKK